MGVKNPKYQLIYSCWSLSYLNLGEVLQLLDLIAKILARDGVLICKEYTNAESEVGEFDTWRKQQFIYRPAGTLATILASFFDVLGSRRTRKAGTYVE